MALWRLLAAGGMAATRLVEMARRASGSVDGFMVGALGTDGL